MVRIGFVFGVFAGLLVPPSGAAAQPPGASEHKEASRLLAGGNAGDAEAALDAAWRAIEASETFAPEDWAGETPEGRILLDELEIAARNRYRRTRARMRITLGDALATLGDAPGAEEEYRRAHRLDPAAGALARIAALPDAAAGERADLLLRTWASGGPLAAEALAALPDTGAFRTADALAATLDRFRFERADESRIRLPEGLARFEGPFPAELTVAIEGGAYSMAVAFDEGRTTLLIYFPAPECPRCSEVVADLQRALAGRPADVLAAAEEDDLAILTRIGRLAGAGWFTARPRTAAGRSAIARQPIGHVVRREALPVDPEFATGEGFVVVARGGLSAWLAPLPEDGSPRRVVETFYRFLDGSPVDGGSEALRAPPESGNAASLIAAIADLETGPQPVADLERDLLASLRRALRDADRPEVVAERLLESVSRLDGAAESKILLVSAMAPGQGARLLEAAQGLDSAIVRAAPDGMVRVALPPRTDNVAGETLIGLVRGYERRDGGRTAVAAVLEAGEAGGIHHVELLAGSPLAAAANETGFAFLSGDPDQPDAACVRFGPADGPFEERCPARLRNGAPVEAVSVLADAGSPDDAPAPDVGEPSSEIPTIWRRLDGGPEPPEVAALASGLEAFARGDVDAAGAAFREGLELLVPGSPVDSAALRYNLALASERAGDRDAALAALQAIGDAPFPRRIERAVRRILASGRR